jgi:hypothetical protein
MTPTTSSTEQPNVVRDLRSLRDQLSQEIKAMSFAEERAYLDQLLAASKANRPEQSLSHKEAAPQAA